jgi:hypothetical protein
MAMGVDSEPPRPLGLDRTPQGRNSPLWQKWGGQSLILLLLFCLNINNSLLLFLLIGHVSHFLPQDLSRDPSH